MRKFSSYFKKWQKCISFVRNVSSRVGDSDVKNAHRPPFSEDPVVMLQEMQRKMKEQSQTSQTCRSRREATKTLFFSKENGTDKTNAFMEKLISMESSLDSTALSTGLSSQEKRKKKKADQIKRERSKLLVFRDVGMSLDKPILSRDVFLIWKYFRLGHQFAIDNELERMLRYFNEHAVNEMKIIDNGKLMRGPETLLKVHNTKNFSRFQYSDSSLAIAKNHPLKFPNVQCYNAAQFCLNPPSGVTDKISQLLFQSESTFKQFVGRRQPELDDPMKFSLTLPKMLISSNFFVRPAVVIFSQLGQKFGADADAAWRQLAFSSICPSLVPPPHADRVTRSISSDSVRQSSLPIDVISLRSSDLYSYKWVQKLVISRFLSSLSKEEDFKNHILAATTFVGSKLLQPFFEVLGVRNYLSPYVLLVDGHGNIRWLSSGLPDSFETMTFPSLLRQLAAEH